MKHKIAVIICGIIIVLTVSFIWNNSRQPTDESKQASAVVAEKLQQIIPEDDAEEEHSFLSDLNMNIRKAAHAIEFFVLGAELAIFSFIVRKRCKPQYLWNILSAALTIAVADESIQILSGRGPKVQDVLLDFGGAFTGILLIFLIYLVVRLFKKRRRKNVKN